MTDPSKRQLDSAGPPTNRNQDGDPTIRLWRCHACGDLRPDAATNVHTRYRTIRSGKRPATMAFNVTHCTDRPPCVEYAQTAARYWHTLGPKGVNDHAVLRARTAAQRSRDRMHGQESRSDRFWGAMGAGAARAVLWYRRTLGR